MLVKNRRLKSKTVVILLALISTITPANAAAGIEYMEPVATGVTLDAIATSGDSIGSYLIGGIPDGMGVIPAEGKLRILPNHEWSSTNPIAAARASSAIS